MNKRMGSKSGMTLVEVLVASSLGTLAMAGILTAFVTYLGSIDNVGAFSLADRNASFALDRMVRGSSGAVGLRGFNYSNIALNSNAGGWVFKDDQGNGYVFDRNNKTISDLSGNLVAKNVLNSSVTNEFDNTYTFPLLSFPI